jgi:DDE superfamily endonuclease
LGSACRKKVTDFLQENPTGVMLSMDEMSLYFQATMTQVWSPVGQTPQVYVSGSRDHAHFYGALNLQTGHQFALPTAMQSSQTTLAFFEDLLLAYPTQPILLFLDRAPWHTANVVTEFFATHPRLHPIHFPPACPDLNPQEHVWSQARAAVSHNHTFRDFGQLKAAFLDFLSTTAFTTVSSLVSVPPILRQLLGQV